MPSGNGLSVMHDQLAVKHTNVKRTFFVCTKFFVCIKLSEKKHEHNSCSYSMAVLAYSVPSVFTLVFSQVVFLRDQDDTSPCISHCSSIKHLVSFYSLFWWNLFKPLHEHRLAKLLLALSMASWLWLTKISETLIFSSQNHLKKKNKTRVLLNNFILHSTVLIYSWSIGPYLQGFEPLKNITIPQCQLSYSIA